MSSNDDHEVKKARVCRFRLFVAGDAPNSRIALENLRRLRGLLAGCTTDIEVVDVVKEPQKAIASGIFVTPALQVLEPSPGVLIFGNLSNDEVFQTLFPEKII